jgi:hypothetical protein
MRSIIPKIVALALLAGCSSTSGVVERNGVAAQLIVKVAAMKYVEQAALHERGARAARVVALTRSLVEVAKGEPITLQRLATIAAEQLPANMEASDRMLAMALISVAQAELQNRIGVGSLESDTLLKLSEVLQWIADAATLYTSP